MSALVYSKTTTRITKHFGHEWHLLNPPVGVQGTQDFFFAAYFYELASAKLRRVKHNNRGYWVPNFDSTLINRIANHDHPVTLTPAGPNRRLLYRPPQFRNWRTYQTDKAVA